MALGMALDAAKRMKVLARAQRWSFTAYDYSHSDPSWKDPGVVPSVFDCSTFICRVAIDALDYSPQLLGPSAAWLLDNLVKVDTPTPGDLVGYGRAPDPTEYSAGHDVIWHVMLYLGAGMVIGACDIAGEVTIRPLDYEAELGDRHWKLIDPPAFRVLEPRPQQMPVPLASIALRRRR